MEKQVEWDKLRVVEDKNNPYTTRYEYDNGDAFYIEPVFYDESWTKENYEGALFSDSQYKSFVSLPLFCRSLIKFSFFSLL